jgi:hypothetical protein
MFLSRRDWAPCLHVCTLAMLGSGQLVVTVFML